MPDENAQDGAEEQDGQGGTATEQTVPYTRFAEVNRTKKKLESELAEAKRFRASLGEDFDAEEYARLKDAAEKAEDEKLTSKGKFEELKQKLTEKHQKELSSKDAEIARRDGFIERLLIDNRLDEAVQKVEVLPEYRAAVKALMKARGPKVVQEGDDYRALMPTDMGEADISTYVEEWARTDEAAPFIRATGLGGSGARGGNGSGGNTGVNPWKKETRNLTEQMRITKENPELARRLAAAVGKTLDL